nr:EpsG family protein [uncultured Bacteroides sp.]
MPAWILYIIVLPFLCFTFKNSKKYEYVPFLVLTVLCMFRYDMVTDYAPYLQEYYDVKNEGIFSQIAVGAFSDLSILLTNKGSEVGYVVLEWLFGFLPYGWVLLFASYIFFLYYLLYQELKRYDVVIIGTLVFILFNYINYYDNVVRQAICIALFMYGYRNYICKGNFWRYIPIVIIGATIHTSMIFALLLYPFLRWAKNKDITLSVSILGVSLAYLFNWLSSSYIVDFTNLINYRNREALEAGSLQDINTGLGLLFQSIMYYLPFYLYKTSKTNNQLYDTVYRYYYWYIVYVIAFCSVFNFIRLSYYLFVVPILAVSLLTKLDLDIKKRCVRFSVFLYLFWGFAGFTRRYYEDYPYKTVLCQDAIDGKVYVRGHSILGVDINRNTFDLLDR